MPSNRTTNGTGKLTAFTATYSQASVIFPFVLIAPAFFAEKIQLGGMMQTVSAFSSVQDSLSFFISSYRTLAEWRDVLADFNGVWSPAGTFAEIHESPQVAANGYLPQVTGNDGSSFRLVAPPYQFDGEHVTPRGLEHVKTARKIQAQNFVEIGGGVVQQALANIDCRRGNHGVNLPVFLFQDAKSLGDRSRIGNIQRKGFRLSPVGANPGGGLLRARTIDIGTDREGAGRG